MTKKELYMLSVKLSGETLRQFFQTGSTGFTDMESNPNRKSARKSVYDILAPHLLDKEVK